METTEALSMAADNPNFPMWLRTACKDAVSECARLRTASGALAEVRRYLQEGATIRAAGARVLDILPDGSVFGGMVIEKPNEKGNRPA